MPLCNLVLGRGCAGEASLGFSEGAEVVVLVTVEDEPGTGEDPPVAGKDPADSEVPPDDASPCDAGVVDTGYRMGSDPPPCIEVILAPSAEGNLAIGKAGAGGSTAGVSALDRA